MRTERSRGFALIGALMVAILFFLLVSILLTDLIRVTRSSATGRSRLVAESLAESGAELAARHMLLGLQSDFAQDLPEGSFEASWQRYPTNLPDLWRFEITVEARSRVLPPHNSILFVEGMYKAGVVEVRRTRHQTSVAPTGTETATTGPE